MVKDETEYWISSSRGGEPFRVNRDYNIMCKIDSWLIIEDNSTNQYKEGPSLYHIKCESVTNRVSLERTSKCRGCKKAIAKSVVALYILLNQQYIDDDDYFILDERKEHHEF